jgi:hypothetical protein
VVLEAKELLAQVIVEGESTGSYRSAELIQARSRDRRKADRFWNQMLLAAALPNKAENSG